MDPATAPLLLALVRQLTAGLAIHRLYDGADAPAFEDAAGRVAVAATAALAGGARHLELRGGRFVGLPRDDGLDKLGTALYERRVEHVELVAAPSPHELRTVYAALTSDPGDLADRGGIATVLAHTVHFIRLYEDAPDPDSGSTSADDLAALDAVPPNDDDDDDLAAIGSDLRPADDARSLLAALRQRAASLSEDVAARSPFYRRAEELARALPDIERQRFDQAILESAPSDPFAERYLGHLTDVALADLVARVARRIGWDPLDLAARVRAHTGRTGSLAQLVMERARSAEGTGGEERPAAMTADPDAPTMFDLEPAAQHPLAAAFPEHAAAGRQLALASLVDLLANAPRSEHLAALPEAVAAELRADLASGEGTSARELLAALDQGARLLGGAPGEQLLLAVGRGLDRDTVVAALRLPAEDALALLAPFGATILPSLVDALDPSLPASTRRRAVDVLTEIGPDHLDSLVETASGRSSGVLLELALVAGRVGGPDVLPLLARLAQTQDALVLARVVDLVVRSDDARGPAILATALTRSRDRNLRIRCLDALGRSTASSAGSVLERLATRGSSPLPGSLRRRARRHLKGRR